MFRVQVSDVTPKYIAEWVLLLVSASPLQEGSVRSTALLVDSNPHALKKIVSHSKSDNFVSIHILSSYVAIFCEETAVHCTLI